MTEKFIEYLAKLLKEPPYLLFIVIGAVFVVTSLTSQRNFNQTWIFFLYSVGGTILRYIERDIRKKHIKIRMAEDGKYSFLSFIEFNSIFSFTRLLEFDLI